MIILQTKGGWNRSISGGVPIVQHEQSPEGQERLQIKQEVEYDDDSYQEDSQQYSPKTLERKPSNRDIEECIRELKRKQFPQKQRRKGYQIKRQRMIEDVPGSASQEMDFYEENVICENGLEEDNDAGDDIELVDNQRQEDKRKLNAYHVFHALDICSEV